MDPRQSLDARAIASLSDVERALLRLRWGALLLLPAVGGLVALAGDGGWRLWVVGVAAAFIAGLALSDRGGPMSAARFARVVAAVFVLHTALITITGGVESPMLPVFVPVAVVLAVLLGQRRLIAALVMLPTAVVLGLLALRWAGVDLGVPRLLRTEPIPFDPVYVTLTALAIVAFMVVGASIGLVLRARLDRAAADLAEARAETLDALATRNRELASLSGSLAHELKNPLAAIQSLSGLVARKLDAGSREADQMRVLIGEVHRLGDILDEFLNLSRPAEGLNTGPVTAHDLLDGVARLYEAAAREAGVRIDVAAGAALSLRCDPRKVRQVLVNLVQNALRVSPPGGVIALRAEAPDADHVSLYVRDQGPGLALPAERLFESGVTTSAEGSGLGLTVARAIARQHGGTLHLVEPADGGVEAALTLPVEPR